jgi:di/tricarboxylate transporter
MSGLDFENKNVVNVDNKTACQELAGGNWTPFVDDATIACAMALILFLVPLHAALQPKHPSDTESQQDATHTAHHSKKLLQQPRILDATDVANLPWGLFLLFGAGFVISDGFEVSGLSLVLGNALAVLAETPPFVAAISISLFVCFVTEVTSNTATTNIMIAVLSPVAVRTGIHPYLLLVPSTVASSLAFMLVSRSS